MVTVRRTWEGAGVLWGRTLLNLIIKVSVFASLVTGDVSFIPVTCDFKINLSFFTDELPPVEQLQAVQQLIDLGVRENKISPDYVLLGHKQARLGTECPGDRLYKEIQTWKNWQPSPTPKVEPKEEIDDGNILKKRTADNAQ